MKSGNQLSNALHVLAHLVGQTQPQTSEQLAACLRTHPVVIRRLLADLRRAGLVSSARGHGGGSVLACDPLAVTLHDVYVAIGEPALIQQGVSDDGHGCPVQQAVNGALADSYRQAQTLLEQRLQQTTLAALGARFADFLASHSVQGAADAS